MSAKIASVLVVLAAAAGCSGERAAKRLPRGEAGADAGESSDAGAGGSANAGGASGSGAASGSGGMAGRVISGSTGGAVGVGETKPFITLDASDCEERPAGDCTGMLGIYGVNELFENTPALLECEEHLSFDGCGRLVFDFNESGCAVSVGPPPEAWDTEEHLRKLRECMTGVFAGGRFECLAYRTLSFHESCFIY